LLEPLVYKPIEVDTLRTLRRNVVVTVLRRKSSLDFGFLLDIADSGIRARH
jgi:hypothetical protein